MSVKQTNEKPKVGDGTPGPGRPKGSVNKIGKAAKDVIATAADQLGGHKRLVAWAKESPENEKAFWTTIYTKLVPIDNHVTGTFNVSWPLPKSPLDL